MAKCAVEGCDRAHYGQGFCNMHWQRRRRGADMSSPVRTRYAHGTVCAVRGCDKQGRLQRGYCNAHYIAYRKYGDPTHSERVSSRRGQADSIPHGTASGYTYHRCRCAECRLYKREDCASRRLADPDKASAIRRASYERNRDRVLASNASWNTRNGAAFKRMTTASYRHAQSATKQCARNHGFRWAPGDDAIVQRNDLSIQELAYLLGRSIAAVTSRRYAIASTPNQTNK